jgi:YVTN family beta-propeller protein
MLVITRGRDNNGPPEVALINPATNRVIDDLSLRRDGAAQTVAVTPNGRFAYSAIFGGTGGVWVIDLATRKTVKVIPTPDKGMVGIAVSPNGRFVIATDFTRGEVSIISTATQRILATIPVGKKPNGVVFSADGRRAFVANQGSTTVSVISFPSGRLPCVFPGRGQRSPC